MCGGGGGVTIQGCNTCELVESISIMILCSRLSSMLIEISKE